MGFTDKEGDKESIYYTITDIQGSVTEIYDEDNKLVWKSGYTAFGIKAGESTKFLDFDGLYTGCDYDVETGLTYHWNRWRSEDGSFWLTQDPIRDGLNWYAYCNGEPINKIDPLGLSTSVDEKTGIILSATNDNDCGVYAYPTVDGQRAEGPGLLIGLTGTPGYFASIPANPGNIQIVGQEKNYIGQNISNYGSGFAYGDFQFLPPKEEMIGNALPNQWEIYGDALSKASFALNCANAGCTLVGQFAVAEGCGTAALGCDVGATICYLAAGCNDKAAFAGMGVLLDLIPYAAYEVKPTLQPAYNAAAQRFINPVNKRFITNAAGYTKYLIGPVTGITYYMGTDIYFNYSSEFTPEIENIKNR